MTQVPVESTPVQSFADCHAGLVATMSELAVLPELIEAERRARGIRARLRRFHDEVVLRHHADEEEELFPAVRQSARAGDERAEVDAMIARLTAQHRHIEAAFARLLPVLLASDDPRAPMPDPEAVEALVAEYLEHARFEEQHFLPLAERILQRDGNHMASLGVSLHLRHTGDAVRRKFGYL